MGTARFEAGAIVQIDGKEHRLYRKISDTLWQLEESKTLRIASFEHRDLLQMYAENRLTFPAGVPAARCGPGNCHLSPEDTEAAKLRRTYVLGVLDAPNTRERMEPAINEVWMRIKAPAKQPAFVTVYRWKTRFMKANEDFRALADDTRSKGNRTSRYPAEVIDCCQQAITALFLKREHSSVQATYEDAMCRVMNENLKRLECDPLPLPTRRLMDRLIAEIPAFDKYSAHHGCDAARNEFRSVKGHRILEKPLDRAEIDHTVLDLIVVDDVTLERLQRPYVTACIDVYSRCILGMYVGFNPR